MEYEYPEMWVLRRKIAADPEYRALLEAYEGTKKELAIAKMNLDYVNNEVAELHRRLEEAERTMSMYGVLGSLVLVDWITG